MADKGALMYVQWIFALLGFIAFIVTVAYPKLKDMAPANGSK